ncbi:MAG: hypothetical protein WC741_01725 [Patescibacteria group bacterium]|jgi:hypothetical protein
MDNSNIRIYLAISGALIVLLILVILIPFSSKKTENIETPTTNQSPFPTSIETNSTDSTNSTKKLTPIPADFTGALEEKIPQPIIDLAAQKKDLRLKTPLSLSTFTIDFDYGEDKFTVTLKEPKDQAQKEFESWRKTNYPLLESSQFLLK